jgi:hypothetical protein
MQIAGAGQVRVWINSADHCEPHAHCTDQAGTWEGRIKFSFLNNIVVYWDCLSKKDPGIRVFNDIAFQLRNYAMECRREWWRCMGSTLECCLVNSMVPDVVGVPRRVQAAVYDAATDATRLTFANGFVREVTP